MAAASVETQRQWSDKAILRTTPVLLGLFSTVTLWAHDLSKSRKLSLIKIGARVIEHIARIRVQLPTPGCCYPAHEPRGAPPSRRPRQINPRRVAQRVASH
jgi:hypothetical protein